jgi:hypothetical protein
VRPPITPYEAIMLAIGDGYGIRKSILRQAEWTLAMDPRCYCTGRDLRCAWTWLVERGCIHRRGGVWESTPACAGVR